MRMRCGNPLSLLLLGALASLANAGALKGSITQAAVDRRANGDSRALAKQTQSSFLRKSNRRLQDCVDLLTLDGPFNGEDSIVPVVGYFFEVAAENSQVIVQALELDVRAGLGNNLAIDVYTTNTPVTQAYNNNLAWGLVARTSLRPNPNGSGGALLAAHQFTPITIEPNTRKSFYLRMKGPYLDHTQDVVAQPGLQAVDGEHMKLYAGYHLDATDAEFPSTLRTNIAPIFAGKMHYEVAKNCDQKTLTSTSMEIVILIDAALLAQDFGNINQAVNIEVNNLLTTDEKLAILATSYNLQMSAAGTNSFLRDYAGDCPPLWALCTAVVANIPLQFSDEITEGDVKEEMYRNTETFSQVMLQSLKEGTQGAYVGLIDTSADFLITLEGVSQTDIMDNFQGLYFQERAVAHANSKLPEGLAQVFKFEIESQKLFNLDSIEIKGKVRGAILSIYTEVDFAARVQATLKQFKDEFIANLKFHQYFPGPMTEAARYEFFADMDDMPIVQIVEVGATPAPTPAPVEEECEGTLCKTTGGSGIDTKYFIYGGIGLGAIILLIILFCCCRSMMRRRDKSGDRELKREESKRSHTLLVNINGASGGKDPPKAIAFDPDDDENVGGSGKMNRRRSSKAGGMSRRNSQNSYSEATDTYFQDEHSVGGSTIETTRDNSNHLYAAPSYKSGSSSRINDYDNEPISVSRRASTGYAGHKSKKKANRRASTGSMDSDDTDDEDRIFSAGRRKSHRAEYDDYDDYKPKRSNSSRSLRSDSHHSSSHRRRHSTSHRGDDRDDSHHSFSSSRKHRGYDDNDESGRGSLSSHGYDDQDYSESNFSESHHSSSHHKKKKKKKKKRKSVKHDMDDINLSSSRHKLKKSASDRDLDNEGSSHSFRD